MNSRNTALTLTGTALAAGLALSALGVSAQGGTTTYGLKAGKPYNNTELRFLSCCPTAGQFAQLAKLSGEGGEFERLTGIRVRWETGPFNAFQQKLLVEASSGNEFDVATWVDSWGEAIKPYLSPLNDRIKADDIDMKDFSDAYVRASSDSGGKGIVYGIPFRGHPLVLFYRKDILAELKLPVPKNWQELTRTAKVIQEKKGIKGLSMYYGVNAGQNMWLWFNHLWSVGGDIFDKNYRPILNNERGVRATQAYVDYLLKDKITAEGSIAYAEQEGNREMLQGRAAMFVGWWWMWTNFKNPQTTDAKVIGNVGFASAPGWAAGVTAPQTYAQIWPIGILKNSRRQDAAWEFIKYATHPEIEKKVALDKSNPVIANNVVVRFSTMQDAQVNTANDGLPRVGAQVLRTARTTPLVRTWAEVQGVLEVGLNEMARGADVKRTLDRMAADIDRIQKRDGYYK